MGGLLIFFAFELYYSLFRILMIKGSNRVDRAPFNFLFSSFENSLIGHSLFHKDTKQTTEGVFIQVHQTFNAS